MHDSSTNINNNNSSQSQGNNESTPPIYFFISKFSKVNDIILMFLKITNKKIKDLDNFSITNIHNEHFDKQHLLSYYGVRYMDIFKIFSKTEIYNNNNQKNSSLISSFLLFNKEVEIKNLEKNISALKSNYDTLNSSYTDLKQKYKSLETEKSNLHDSYNLVNNNYNVLKTNFNDLNKTYNTLNSDYNTLKSTYTTLDNDHTLLNSNYNAFKISNESIKASQAIISKNFSNISKENKALQLQISKLEKSNEESQKKIDSLNSQISTAMSTISNFKFEVTSLTNESTSKSYQITKINKTIEDLNKKLLTKTTQLSIKTKDLIALKNKVNKLTKALSDSNAENLLSANKYKDLNDELTYQNLVIFILNNQLSVFFNIISNEYFEPDFQKLLATYDKSLFSKIDLLLNSNLAPYYKNNNSKISILRQLKEIQIDHIQTLDSEFKIKVLNLLPLIEAFKDKYSKYSEISKRISSVHEVLSISNDSLIAREHVITKIIEKLKLPNLSIKNNPLDDIESKVIEKIDLFTSFETEIINLKKDNIILSSGINLMNNTIKNLRNDNTILHEEVNKQKDISKKYDNFYFELLAKFQIPHADIYDKKILLNQDIFDRLKKSIEAKIDIHIDSVIKSPIRLELSNLQKNYDLLLSQKKEINDTTLNLQNKLFYLQALHDILNEENDRRLKDLNTQILNLKIQKEEYENKIKSLNEEIKLSMNHKNNAIEKLRDIQTKFDEISRQSSIMKNNESEIISNWKKNYDTLQKENKILLAENGNLKLSKSQRIINLKLKVEETGKLLHKAKEENTELKEQLINISTITKTQYNELQRKYNEIFEESLEIANRKSQKVLYIKKKYNNLKKKYDDVLVETNILKNGNLARLLKLKGTCEQLREKLRSITQEKENILLKLLNYKNAHESFYGENSLASRTEDLSTDSAHIAKKRRASKLS
ncbi:uncharacterized protein ASCRUDRAFT_115766 [Ascoidea rubescens DSM 1968]|uniref:Uncharacterized protein n=1 Tax=Ascoidea rubescens DSM 1968 TaxID=1344418 RepID=A0A1D2VBQ5_9ASCO|nr:hypothetical protein ASCRUDRAFT_115766 [Ascoidea rubescens DSM 1968]ODV59045.1 hypothetical protein ASCRUDRAFT_115766 [Ascoidea rubescens DSM 1968]